mgnify:CR=1 FL=1
MRLVSWEMATLLRFWKIHKRWKRRYNLMKEISNSSPLRWRRLSSSCSTRGGETTKRERKVFHSTANAEQEKGRAWKEEESVSTDRLTLLKKDLIDGNQLRARRLDESLHPTNLLPKLLEEKVQGSFHLEATQRFLHTFRHRHSHSHRNRNRHRNRWRHKIHRVSHSHKHDAHTVNDTTHITHSQTSKASHSHSHKYKSSGSWRWVLCVCVCVCANVGKE